MAATAIPRTGMSSLTYIPPAATKAIMLMSKPTTFFMFFTLIRAGRNFLFLPTLKAFRLPLDRSRWGRRQQKKPAPQSYLEVKALALPETKIRKAVRALWARSVSVLPCFVQICEILTFRQVVSLPIFSDCKYTHYFIPQWKKCDFAPKKTALHFPLQK